MIVTLQSALRGPGTQQNFDYLRQWAREYTWDCQRLDDPGFSADVVMSGLEGDVGWQGWKDWDGECVATLRAALVASAERHNEHWQTQQQDAEDSQRANFARGLYGPAGGEL